ncbi:MAG: translation initiation factor IF-3 [Actinomycetota bacterium]
MPTATALSRAKELDLDLVEVAPQAEPPVCRIMDFGKWKYEQDVRAKESRKKQSQVIVKEMKFRPKISDHDFGIKRGHVERFLEEGDKVKVTIMFRGREMAHTELGAKLLDRLAKDLSDLSAVEAAPKQDGRNMTMVLGPTRKPVKQQHKEAAHKEAAHKGGPPKEAAAKESPLKGPLDQGAEPTPTVPAPSEPVRELAPHQAGPEGQ